MAVGWHGFIRGVNLGSSFIPEHWMTPGFYSGTGTWTLCELVEKNRTAAEERMRHHLSTFVTEDDFRWLASRGFNAVRVPVGYWNAVSEGKYVPADVRESLAVLDRMFAWATLHDIGVLIGLHGAPGSQNGADHSGCGDGRIGWGSEGTVELTLAAIDALARRYGHHPTLIGIELLNEPAWKVEWNHGGLLEYYTRARAIVRAASPHALVVFNVLYSSDFPGGFGNWWAGQLIGPDVMLDLHLYDCYDNASRRTVEEHVAQAKVWRAQIDLHQSRGHRVIVGE